VDHREKRGTWGDEGDMGNPGTCEASCRDDICINAVKEEVKKELKNYPEKDN